MAEELPPTQVVTTMDEDESETEGEETPAAATAKAKYPCLRCKNNVTKAGVRCNSCHLWVHNKCQSISKELFAILRNPGKFGGVVVWNCDSCAASALRLEKRMVAIETKFEEVEGRIEKNEMNVMEVERRVDTVEKRQDKVEDMLARERERARKERIEETRERDVRKKNVVIHRIVEAGDWAKTIEERREWDTKSCENIFAALKMDFNRRAIRFCRRVGERGEAPRPLVVGLCRESQKEDLLDMAHELKDTAFADIGIVPDLTREQRRDESEMVKEAEKRNETRNQDDVAKNLTWKVVGRRGEKRLVKSVDREGGGGAGLRGRGGGGQLRGGGQGRLLTSTRGGRGGAWTPRGAEAARAGETERERVTERERETERERVELLDMVREGGTQTRARTNSKRSRDEDAEDARPAPRPPAAMIH